MRVRASGVAQVPFNKELDLVAHPSMGDYLVDEPFGIVWAVHVIEGLGIPFQEEPIVVGLVSSQQIDMEGGIYSSTFELLGQLEPIIVHL